MPTSAGLLPVSPPGPITWTKPSPRRQAQWRRPDARRAQTAPRDARRPQQTGQIVQLPSASPRARTTQPTAREEARGALPEVATTGATFTKRQPSLLEVSKRVRVGTRLTQASEKSYRSLLRLLHAPQQRLPTVLPADDAAEQLNKWQRVPWQRLIMTCEESPRLQHCAPAGPCLSPSPVNAHVCSRAPPVRRQQSQAGQPGSNAVCPAETTQAPSASLDHPKAQAACMRPRAPPEQLESSPWPQGPPRFRPLQS